MTSISRKFTKEAMAQADRCDAEKVRDFYPWMTVTRGDTSPDGRRLESDPMYQILEKAKDRYGR